MSLTVCLTLACSLAAPAQPPAAEPEVRRILVLDLKPTGGDVDGARALTIQIAEELGDRPELRVVTVGDIISLVELGTSRQALGCDDDTCIASLSAAANAQLALSGTLGKIGRELLLTLSLMDTERVRPLRSASRSAIEITELREQVPALVAEVFGGEVDASQARRYRLPDGREVSFAVFDIEGLGIEEAVAKSLTQILAVEIKRIEGTRVISRDDIIQMLQLEAGKSLLDCQADNACLAEIGGALGVELLVLGSAGKLGERFVVSLRLIDVNNAEVKARLSETFSGQQEQLIPALRMAVRRLLSIEDEDPGSLAMSANEPGAAVFVDEIPMGELPMPAIDALAAGKHRVRVSKDGFFEWSSDVFVSPGGATPLWAELSKKPPEWYETWWFWTMAGAVVVGGAVATTIAVATASDSGSIELNYRRETP